MANALGRGLDRRAGSRHAGRVDFHSAALAAAAQAVQFHPLRRQPPRRPTGFPLRRVGRRRAGCPVRGPHTQQEKEKKKKGFFLLGLGGAILQFILEFWKKKKKIKSCPLLEDFEKRSKFGCPKKSSDPVSFLRILKKDLIFQNLVFFRSGVSNQILRSA